MKDHKSHDVVLLCTTCHQQCSVLDDALKQQLAIKCDAPLSSGQSAKFMEDPMRAKVRSAGKWVFFFFASDMHDILVAIWGLTPNQSMCEISQWFSMADSLKILKHLALGHFSHYPLMSEHPLWQKRSRKGVERLILNHDTIPYLRMKRNFIHTYCTLVWGTVINLGLAFRIGWQFPNPSLLLFWFVYCEKKNQCSFCLLW